ncbi:MAG: tetratricopeptide repeat protein [Acidobacteriota bacterium]
MKNTGARAAFRFRAVGSSAALLLFCWLVPFQATPLQAQTGLVEDGNALAARGEYEAADRAFARELESHPGDYRLLYNRALANHLGGHHDKAKAILLTVPVPYREEGTYCSLLGAVLTSLGDYRAALTPTRQAITKAPKDANLLLNLAALYLRLRMGQHAADVYDEGRRLFPDRPEFLLGLGVIEQMQAKFEAAARIYRSTTEAFPAWETGFLYLAHAQIKSGLVQDARATLRDVLSRHPNSAVGHYLAGEAWWATPGAEEEARAATWEALRLDPNLAEAHLLAAKIELRAGSVESAISHLLRSEKLNPNIPLTQYLLSLAYRRHGKLKDAQAAMTQFQTLKAKSVPDHLSGSFLVD